MTRSLSLHEAFSLYEKARCFMPKPEFPVATRQVQHLVEIADEFDVAVLDSFGVLNVGDAAIPGAAETIGILRSRNKHIIVLTNGATLDQPGAVAKVRGFGFDIDSQDVISSRSALEAGLKTYSPDMLWGIMAPEHANCQTLGVNFELLHDDPETYLKVDGFILLSTHDWSLDRQEKLQASLAFYARPILVGNPDLVAPRETYMSTEPGYFAWLLHEATGLEILNFGKPHADVFEQAKRRIREVCGSVEAERILMVGDSLHTDILGGASAGFKTVLTTQDGFLSGVDAHDYIQLSGIRPDIMLPRI